jgi:hypothetical protein
MKHNYDKHVERMANWNNISEEEEWASKVCYFVFDELVGTRDLRTLWGAPAGPVRAA